MKDFIFKPFDEMTPEDYREVGFMSGLEVHQQLFTEKKLFCRCPAGKYNNYEYNAEILRHMRPTLSELGEYDGTALMEFKTKKDIIYRINYDTVCTYEMDDTPPFEINDQALDIAFEIGLLFNASLVDELHIARKQYLDGSIPTGFQRTAITSVGGFIPYKDKKINLIQMSIEEDSCREASDVGHKRVYLTDRLGMPLVETVTYPEMKTPQEVAEVNEILRRLVRSTGKVRTGIGAAREDVNVSVEGGTRIEIKGVPRIPLIPLLTYNEAMRQWNLLRLREELKKRGITPESFNASFDNVTKLLTKTRYNPIHTAIGEGKIVNCIVLRGFKGLLRWQTQTDTYFSREISDRVRVIACLTTLPNIIHSDSTSETLSGLEWQKVKKAVAATDEDTVVLVWGSHQDAETGAKEIIIRAKEATIGVPSETRQALYDGTNGFERILPGPERMYPDTDLPPKKITDERKATIKARLPKPFWEREAWYATLDVPKDIVKDLAISKFAKTFETLVNDYAISPKLASVALINYPKKMKKRGKNIDNLTSDMFLSVFDYYKGGLLSKDGIFFLLEKFVESGKVDKSLLPDICSDAELSFEVKQAAKKIEKMKLYSQDNVPVLTIAAVMTNLRGRINGNTVEAFVNNFYSKEGK